MPEYYLVVSYMYFFCLVVLFIFLLFQVVAEYMILICRISIYIHPPDAIYIYLYLRYSYIYYYIIMRYI